MQRQASRSKMILGLGIGGGAGVLLLLGGFLLVLNARQAVLLAPLPTLIPTYPPAAPTEVSHAIPASSPSPLSSPALTSPPTPTAITYTVLEGDTLFAIAERFGITVESLKAANNLEGDTIYPDQVLIIPSGQVLLPTSTPFAAGETIVHVVGSGDTLSSIAEQYGVTVDALKAANGLDGDLIFAGQTLFIPISGTLPVAIWRPSILVGDLTSAYPGILETERFTLHYTPGTYPAQDLQSVVEMETRALGHLERVLNGHLEGRFDVYVAGTLFAPPDQALRGRSFSADRRTFFLHDGSGNPADQQYIVTHELTHLFSWNVFGRPSSAMLSEGAAVYAGMSLIADSDHIPISVFCAAYYQAGVLPSVSANLSFQGHIRDLQNYYAAGCFVQYLINTYGPEKFGQLYPSSDYTGIYGRSLAALEQEWIADLKTNGPMVPFDPDDLIAAVESVGTAYDKLFSRFTGTPAQMAAYGELDAARIAMLEGRFGDVTTHLTAFEQLLGQ